LASCTGAEVDRRIAQGRARARAAVTGLAIVGLALAVYVVSNLGRNDPGREVVYNHYVWQASAWLDGQASIPYPVHSTDGSRDNYWFQDVQEVPDTSDTGQGRALLPFPPLPALIVLPFVVLWGLTTDAQLIATIIGALDVGLAYWMLGRLRVRRAIRVAVTIFFGLGTVFWYTAEKGTTWFLAHVVAVGLMLLAVGIALDADRAAADGALGQGPEAQDWSADGEALEARGPGIGAHGIGTVIDGRQFLAGVLLGLAATARLTVIFAAPFFLFVGGGGNWRRRALSAGLGAALPVVGLVIYNLVSTGHLFNPVYDVLYHREAEFYTFLNYHTDWSIEDPRYIPQNLFLMLVNPPEAFPTALQFGQQLCEGARATRSWFDPTCPILMPSPTSMGLLLTSPAYLLGLPALLRYGRSRLVTGSALAVLLVSLVNLMHFSQGWVQFGYRFSLDFVPWALLLVAVGLERLGGVRPTAMALIVISVVINLWGVWWAASLGW
jgi:hypothetical protein